MRVFISHAFSDRTFATSLAEQLRGQGHTPWNDSEISAGENWALAVGKALNEADALIVLLSPDAMKSERVTKELEFALGNQRFEGRLIPIEIKATRDKPWILKELQLIRAASPAAAGQAALERLGAKAGAEKTRASSR
jgi:TIR domain